MTGLTPDERAFWRTAASGVSYGVNVKSSVILALLDAADELDRIKGELGDPSRHSIMGGWLVIDTRQHNCGTGPGGHFGAHEPGCGLEQAVQLDSLPGWSPDADRILRLRRLATDPIDTDYGEAILVADVLDILDDNNGPDELDRLRVTVQLVRQACREDTHAAILAILDGNHG